MTPAIKAQRAYRARRTAKIERLKEGHRAVIAKLDGNTKPLAVAIRAISVQALNDQETSS